MAPSRLSNLQELQRQGPLLPMQDRHRRLETPMKLEVLLGSRTLYIRGVAR